jgi:hypothetical protein
MPKPIIIKNLDRLGNYIYLHPSQGLIVDPENPKILMKFHCYSDLLNDVSTEKEGNKVYDIKQTYNLDKWCDKGDVFLGEISVWLMGDGKPINTSIIARKPFTKKPENVFVIMPLMAEVVMEAHQKLVLIVYNDIKDMAFTPKIYNSRDVDALDIQLVNSYEATYIRGDYFWMKQYGQMPYNLNTPPMLDDDKIDQFSLFGYTGTGDTVKAHVYEFILTEDCLKRSLSRKSGYYASATVKVEYYNEDLISDIEEVDTQKSWYEFNLQVYVSKNKDSIKGAIETRIPANQLWITEEKVKKRKTETSPNGKELIFPDILNNALFFNGRKGSWIIWIPRSIDSSFYINKGSKVEGCEISGEVLDNVKIHNENFTRIELNLELSPELFYKLDNRKNLAVSMISSASILENFCDCGELSYKFNIYFEGHMACSNSNIIQSLRNKDKLHYNYPPALPVKKKNKKIRFYEHFKGETLLTFFGYHKVIVLEKALESHNKFNNKKQTNSTKLLMEKSYGTDDTDYSQDPWRLIRFRAWELVGE